MKIYTRVVIDMKTGNVVEEDSYEYSGPVALCGGSGGGTTYATTTSTGEIDYVYNARMASVAERQQYMAEEYLAFWREEYKPMERAQIQANIGLIPEQAEHERERLRTERMQFEQARDLMPQETEYKRGLLQLGSEEITAAKPVMSEYYKEALNAADPDTRVQEARADVAMSFKEAEAQQRREMGRLGLDPSSKRYQGMARDRNMEQAKMTAGAMYGARTEAENERFQRLQNAASTFKGGLGRY